MENTKDDFTQGSIPDCLQDNASDVPSNESRRSFFKATGPQFWQHP